MSEASPVMTTEQVADYLQASTRFVTERAKDGSLKGFKVGRYWRFKRAEIDAWVDAGSR